MGETCAVCGREKSRTDLKPESGKCGRETLAADRFASVSLECYRLGYERSQEALAAELRAYIAEREPAEKRIAELEATLLECVGIVDAAGLLNLSNGVQLGQTSWYVKAFDAFDHARKLAARAAKAKGEGR